MFFCVYNSSWNEKINLNRNNSIIFVCDAKKNSGDHYDYGNHSLKFQLKMTLSDKWTRWMSYYESEWRTKGLTLTLSFRQVATVIHKGFEFHSYKYDQNGIQKGDLTWRVKISTPHHHHWLVYSIVYTNGIYGNQNKNVCVKIIC